MAKYKPDQQLQNIAPENRLQSYEKLLEKGIEFQKIPLIKLGKRMGVNCPELHDTFAIKQYCKACPRWLGGTGGYYYCKKII